MRQRGNVTKMMARADTCIIYGIAMISSNTICSVCYKLLSLVMHHNVIFTIVRVFLRITLCCKLIEMAVVATISYVITLLVKLWYAGTTMYTAVIFELNFGFYQNLVIRVIGRYSWELLRQPSFQRRATGLWRRDGKMVRRLRVLCCPFFYLTQV